MVRSRIQIQRKPRVLIITLLALISALLLIPTAAFADAVGEDYADRISGNVKNEGTPLEGVLVSVSGGGYTAEVVTDIDGKWRIGVPQRGTYTVTLDESTLPEGIAVVEGSSTQEVEVGPSGRVTMNFFIGAGERNVTSFFDQLIQRLVNGVNFGLMLGLAAIGLSLVWGTTGLSNFAHAEMVTFGALAALFLSNIGITIWLAIPLAVVLSGILGYVMDVGLWRPLRKNGIGLIQMWIVSIGLSLALRYTYQFFVGGGTVQLPGVNSPKLTLFGAVSLSVIDMVSMGISVVVIAAFAWWLLFTRVGKATRAISDNPSLAAASGIDVDRVVRIVWILGAALAGLGGVLWAYFRPGIKWDMGQQILLLIFVAVTLGGLGSAFGALVGALIIGILIEVSTLWIPSDLKYAGALIVLILILLFRPQGVLGRRERIG